MISKVRYKQYIYCCCLSVKMLTDVPQYAFKFKNFNCKSNPAILLILSKNSYL